MDPHIFAQLEKRFSDEILAKAYPSKQLVKCRQCEFPVEMNCSPKIVQVFHCPNCLNEFCRRCNDSFDWRHLGGSCEENKKKEMEKLEKAEREV